MAGAKNSGKDDGLIGEPLDKLTIPVNSRNGIHKRVTALSVGFMTPKTYIRFKPPPVTSSDKESESLTAEEEEWLERMSFYESDLNWLLRLPYQRFWCQVMHDENLNIFLESYLTQAIREYDLAYVKIKKELMDALHRVHKLVFFAYLRMSIYKESKRDHLTPEMFGRIIYETYTFDIPKIMDVCALYGVRNRALLSKMIENVFNNQPRYFEDLSEAARLLLLAFDNAEESVRVMISSATDEEVDEATGGDTSKNSPSSLKRIIRFITDTSFTLGVFLEVYPMACDVFYANDMVMRIPSFYEKVFPSLEEYIFKHKVELQSVLEEYKDKLSLSKTFLVKIFRYIIEQYCIQPIIQAKSDTENAQQLDLKRIEDFLHIFTGIACHNVFLEDYNSIFPFEKDVQLFNDVGFAIDLYQLNYILCSIQDVPDTVKNEVNATDNNTDKFKEGYACQSSPDLSEPQIASLIQSVLDVFPDYGEGFVKECLDYYNFDSEKVIDALLTSSLPKHLDKLDRSMKREETQFNNEIQNGATCSVLTERQNVYDNDEFDIFSRSDVRIESIHLGKKDKTPDSYNALANEKDADILKEAVLAYKDETPSYDETYLYEDEYDDTYDSLAIGVREPVLEIEPSVKRVSESSEEEEEPEKETSPNKKLDFCINPEILREKAEQRRQAKMAQRNHGKGSNAPSNQAQNYNYKDKNKSRIANHSRRKQSDFKKSKGMMPF